MQPTVEGAKTMAVDVKYRTQVTSTGGRAGKSISSDGKLDLEHSVPKELGGDGGDGPNPEQLFAAGYSACFLGAMQYVAKQDGIDLSSDTAVTADVGVGPEGVGFGIDVELSVANTGLSSDEAKALVDKAHKVCPYSKALQGTMDVKTIVG